MANAVGRWVGQRKEIIAEYVKTQYGANLTGGVTFTCNQTDNFKFIYTFKTNTDIDFRLILRVRYEQMGISITVVSKGKITNDGYTENHNTIDGLQYKNQEPLRF